jgi:hypothetical protein
MDVPGVPSYLMTAITTAVQTAVEDAMRLGLTWRLRPGTVAGAGVSNPESVPVRVDGDSGVLRARSMVGALASGQRVWCVQVPPAGIYVLGILGPEATMPTTAVFTANGTWTHPVGLAWADGLVTGGGGAGGGAAATAAGEASMGGGGGGGATALMRWTGAELPATVTVTIGLGGTGAAGANGNPGGTSSFGTLLTANGGDGGSFRNASAVAFGVEAGAGSVTVGGTGARLRGGSGGEAGWGSGQLGISGSGGASHMGGGAAGRRTTTAGQTLPGRTGRLYGGGGSGAVNSGGVAAAAGGPGAAGIAVITEYY